MGPGLEVATDYSFAYGHGQAMLPDGTLAEGAADNFGSWLTIVPRRLEARLSPIQWFDLGTQIGWLEGAVDARLGLPGTGDAPLPFNLAAGFQTGEAGPFKDTKPLRSRWIRLEAYPLLPTRNGGLRLVLAAGLHAGTFYHEVPDPRPQPDAAGEFPDDAVQLIRRETRLETSVGIVAAGRRGSVLFTASPYFVLDAGGGESCDGCDPVASYRQGWGIVLVTRFALRLGF